MDGPWSLISGAGAGDIDANNTPDPDVKASDDNYMPAKDIVGMYLRVTVTYTDKHGDDKPAMDGLGSHSPGGTQPEAQTRLPVFSVGRNGQPRV